MPHHRLLTVDVFSTRALRGNPVAVVLDADDIPPEEMQRLAAWTNLSETAFVLRPTTPTADYRLRIFTPRSELPFAGHPTVGSAHAVFEAGIVASNAPRLTQECGVGLVPIRSEPTADGRLLLARVPRASVRRDRAVDSDAVARALVTATASVAAPLVVDVGAVWLVAALAGEDTVRTLNPDSTAVAALSREHETVGVTVFALNDTGGVVVRSFAPVAGIVEDHVCGSGNAAVAAYAMATGRLSSLGRAWLARQGREVGRDGAVVVRVAEDGGIEIGGRAVTVVDGCLRL